MQGSVSATAVNNIIVASPAVITISSNNVGYSVWNTPTTGSITISGGSVNNATYGVWVNNYDGYQSPGASTLATITGVTIAESALAGVYVQDDPRASTNGVVLQATVTGNTVINGSPVGVWTPGTNAAALVPNNTAWITGNQIGVEVDTGRALIQNNDLTGNTVAGIWATNGATVDAGNCTGVNVTGLGISAGGNNLSGYLAGTAKAIVNANAGGTPLVLADHDNFGAVSTNDVIADALTGQVDYSQTPAVIAAPANVLVTCVSEVPAAVATLTDFISAGGYFSANSGVTVSSSDTTNYTSPSPYIGSGVITRTYIIADGCSVATSAVQTITFSNWFRRPSPVCR